MQRVRASADPSTEPPKGQEMEVRPAPAPSAPRAFAQPPFPRDRGQLASLVSPEPIPPPPTPPPNPQNPDSELAKKRAQAERLRAAEKFMVIGSGTAQCKGCG